MKKDNFQHKCLVVFQYFNGWLDAYMNYKYRITWDIGAIWIEGECSVEWHFTAIYSHITQMKYIGFRAYMVLEM
jgi:hypothetical protein